MSSTSHSCSCCSCAGHQPSSQPLSLSLTSPVFTRREFIAGVSAVTLGGLVLQAKGAAECAYSPKRRSLARSPLRVQPVLTYDLPRRRQATSWRGWGGIQTEADAAAEKQRIGKELAKISSQAEFPLEILPLAATRSMEEAAALAKGAHDVMLIYAAGGSLKLLETLTTAGKSNLMFLRHDSGPVYLWYEIVHPRFLRKMVDDYGQAGWDVDDVVVDKPSELLWRMRALHGLKGTLGKKIVCIGGAGGWGAGGRTAPARSKELWKMDLADYAYKDLGPRIQQARKHTALVSACQAAAAKYLRKVSAMATTREFVSNAFILAEVFKDIMDEAQTDAITINSCMGTIMPMAETTACLTLSLLNDDGYQAFCESDFVVIPSGVLLHYISGLPVFLNDPTTPHDKMVTLAHCTAPRKMDGRRLDPVKILTHFESDYGAAPKVEMRIGQRCTNLVPDFASKKWVGFDGTVMANPFLDICRSQVDVRINGDAAALLREMKGFHWMMSYGDYLRECGYALKKVGVDFLNVSAATA